MLHAGKDFRVNMIEATGTGGIAHYSYFLANALTDIGVSVTVHTSQVYELGSWPRRFRLLPHMGGSRTKDVLVRCLSRRGRPSQMQSTRPPENLVPRQRGIPRTRSSRDWLRPHIAWVEILYDAWAKGARLLHVQWPPNDAKELTILGFARKIGYRTIHTVHNLFPHDNDSQERERRYVSLYNTVDHLIVHANENRDALCCAARLSPEKVSVIPHGNFHGLAEGQRHPQAVARRKFGIPLDVPVVLFFGSLRPYKGLDVLERAWPTIMRSLPKAWLLVAGSAIASEPDGPITRLRQLAHVLVKDYFVPLDEIGWYFSAGDVVVLPYHETTHSGLIHLANAFMRPAVASRVGGIPEVIQDGKTGILVPPNDPEALVQALVTLLEDRQRAMHMGRQAFELGEREFAWEHIARQTAQVYRRVITCEGGLD